MEYMRMHQKIINKIQNEINKHKTTVNRYKFFFKKKQLAVN